MSNSNPEINWPASAVLSPYTYSVVPHSRDSYKAGWHRPDAEPSAEEAEANINVFLLGDVIALEELAARGIRVANITGMTSRTSNGYVNREAFRRLALATPDEFDVVVIHEWSSVGRGYSDTYVAGMQPEMRPRTIVAGYTECPVTSGHDWYEGVDYFCGHDSIHRDLADGIETVIGNASLPDRPDTQDLEIRNGAGGRGYAHSSEDHAYGIDTDYNLR